MKKIYLLVALCCLAAAACTKHKMGGGFSVMCACYKDTIKTTYNMGSKYTPYDTLYIVKTYYTDSCNKLRAQNGWDSSHVWVLTL